MLRSASPSRLRAVPRLLAALLALGLLAGCATAKSAPEAAVGFIRLDAIAQNPADFRAAFRLPESFGPAAPRASLTLSAKREGGERIVTRLALTAVTDGSEQFALAEFAKPGFAVTALRIAPSDLAAAASFRDSARAMGLDRLDITVEPEACRRPGAAETALVTTYLRTDPSAPYLVLARETDTEKGDRGSKLPAC